MSKSQRVVVTGIGMITSLGVDAPSTWSAMLESKSGISAISDFHPTALAGQFAGRINNVQLRTFRNQPLKKMDLFVQYGLHAAQEAIKDAGFLDSKVDPKRIGVSIGSGLGGMASVEKQHQHLLSAIQHGQSPLKRISPFFIPGSIINMLSGLCAIEYGFQGPNFSVVSACATGAHNIGISRRYIQDKEADVMIVGGAELSSTPLTMAGFAACRALATHHIDPTHASRPWDKDRNGFVLSDGAGILVLEAYEHAIKRGATMYGELLGVGMSADAYAMTAPEPNGQGAALAMQRALDDANIDLEEIDYINAHATSTIQGDIAEIKAIESVWKDKTSTLKISSTKSMTGHLLGAAGSLEAAFCLLCIKDQIVPPTINLHSLDARLSNVDLVPHYAQEGKIRTVLSNSFGFGGTNISLIFRQI